MKLELSQSSGVPFWRQIRDQLADRIRTGSLPAGAGLPSVRQLAEECLVSVITVRRAYDELEAAGLALSQQGRGTFVSEGSGAASRADLLRSVEVELRTAITRARSAALTEAEIEGAWRSALGASTGEAA